MKLYLFYLVIDEKMIEKFNNEDVDNFVEATEFLSYNKFKNENKDKGIYKYLYAHTLNKKMAKKFEEIHNMKFFIKRVKTIDDEEYTDMYSDIIGTELCQKNLKNGGMDPIYKDCDKSLILTNNEYDSIESIFYTNLMEAIMACSSYAYELYKDKYIVALDKLLYCTYHKTNYYDSDYYSYNFSFGITAEGCITAGKAGASGNLLNIYIHYFKLVLKGYDKNEDL